MYLRAEAGFLHTVVVGDGPTVVVLPDSPGSAAALAPQLAPLGAEYRLVLVDLPGHGATTIAPDRADPVGQAAAVVVELLARMLDGPVPVVGFGAGTAVVARLGAEHADRVSVLVAAGAPHHGAPPPPPGRFEPVGDGSHLLAVWTEVRESARYRPWWSGRRADLRSGAQPSPAVLHAATVDTLAHGDDHRPLLQAAWAAPPQPLLSTVVLDDVVPALPALRTAFGAAFATTAGRGRRVAAPAGSPARFGDGVGGPGYLAGLHVRLAGTDWAGRRTPVVVLPAAPGSSTILDPLIDRLAMTRPVIGIDYPGHGRTPPLDIAEPTLEDYVEVLGAALGQLDGGPFDVYGTHSGASLAAELGHRFPSVVRRLVLDGTPLLPSELVDELLEENFVSLDPDRHGSHLARAWGYVVDRSLWWPWYRQDGEHALPGDRPLAPVLHHLTTDLLRGAATYHLLYAAALRHDVGPVLEALGQPVLVCGRAADPVDRYRPAVAARVPRSRCATVDVAAGEDGLAAVARTAAAFFDEPDL